MLSADDADRRGDDHLASRFRRLARFKRRPRFPGPRSDANGSGKKHGFALADHQVVFAGTKFVASVYSLTTNYFGLKTERFHSWRSSEVVYGRTSMRKKEKKVFSYYGYIRMVAAASTTLIFRNIHGKT